MDKNICKKHK